MATVQLPRPASPRDALADGKARLQDALAGTAGGLWDELPSHDEANVPELAGAFLPVLDSAQREVIALTDAYVAAELDRELLGLEADPIIAGIRGGVAAADVYRRPFVTLWSGLARGEQWVDAAAAGRARLVETVKMDVALAPARALDAVRVLDPEVL